jgi:hypothetical protein
MCDGKLIYHGLVRWLGSWCGTQILEERDIICGGRREYLVVFMK